MNFNEIILNYQALDKTGKIVDLIATFTLPVAGIFLFIKIVLGAVVMVYVAKKIWR